jgi:hypothetical protein
LILFLQIFDSQESGQKISHLSFIMVQLSHTETASQASTSRFVTSPATGNIESTIKVASSCNCDPQNCLTSVGRPAFVE